MKQTQMTLRQARFERCMTQFDLWIATGISAPRISLAERGYQILKRKERVAIAGALGMSIESIDFDSPYRRLREKRDF